MLLHFKPSQAIGFQFQNTLFLPNVNQPWISSPAAFATPFNNYKPISFYRPALVNASAVFLTPGSAIIRRFFRSGKRRNWFFLPGPPIKEGAFKTSSCKPIKVNPLPGKYRMLNRNLLEPPFVNKKNYLWVNFLLSKVFNSFKFGPAQPAPPIGLEIFFPHF